MPSARWRAPLRLEIDSQEALPGLSTVADANGHAPDMGALAVLDQSPVKFGPAVAEETERCAVLVGSREIEGRDQHARLLRAEFRQDVAALVADEAVAIEALAVLGPDAVGGDHGDD